MGICRLCNGPLFVYIPETNSGRNIRNLFTEQAKLWGWAHPECKGAFCSSLTGWQWWPDSAEISLCWADLKRQFLSAWQPSLHSFDSLINTFLPLGSRELLNWWKEPHTVCKVTQSATSPETLPEGWLEAQGCSFPFYSWASTLEWKADLFPDKEWLTKAAWLPLLGRWEGIWLCLPGYLLYTKYLICICDAALLLRRRVREQTRQAQVTHGALLERTKRSKLDRYVQVSNSCLSVIEV